MFCRLLRFSALSVLWTLLIVLLTAGLALVGWWAQMLWLAGAPTAAILVILATILGEGVIVYTAQSTRR